MHVAYASFLVGHLCFLAWRHLGGPCVWWWAHTFLLGLMHVANAFILHGYFFAYLYRLHCGWWFCSVGLIQAWACLLSSEMKRAWHIDGEQLSCLLLALLGTSLYLWYWQLCWVDSNKGDALFVWNRTGLAVGWWTTALWAACFAWHVASLQTFVSASTQVMRVACSFGCGWPSGWHLWFLSLYVYKCVMNSSPTQKKKRKKKRRSCHNRNKKHCQSKVMYQLIMKIHAQKRRMLK